MRARVDDVSEVGAGACEADADPVEVARRRIRVALDQVAEARVELEAAVDAARAEGLSWAAIGAVLGVSRQSAHERFARLD